MNPITLPILITIAVVGIIAIVLVKLLYSDKENSDLSNELPPIVTNHWQESFDEIHEENDSNYDKDLNEYGFVSKSWVEPMKKTQELNNGVASKVFQEPMHSKHQDIISKEYPEDTYTEIKTGIDNPYKNTFNSNDNEFDDLRNNNPKNNIDNLVNKPEQINNDPINEYITPKKYYSQNNDYTNYEDNYENNEDIYENNKGNDENNYKKMPNYDYDNINDKNGINEKNFESDYKLYNEYSNPDSNAANNSVKDSFRNDNLSENKKETLDDFGVITMGEQVIIGGSPYTINVGDEIIFNYNGESYSSKILEIKHENIRVKYRSKEKWINFSDIKKIF